MSETTEQPSTFDLIRQYAEACCKVAEGECNPHLIAEHRADADALLEQLRDRLEPAEESSEQQDGDEPAGDGRIAPGAYDVAVWISGAGDDPFPFQTTERKVAELLDAMQSKDGCVEVQVDLGGGSRTVMFSASSIATVIYSPVPAPTAT